MRIDDLKEQRTKHYNTIKTLTETFKKNDQKFTADEAKQWQEVNAAYDAVATEIETIQGVEKRTAEMNGGRRGEGFNGAINPHRIGLSDSDGGGQNQHAGGMAFLNTVTGDEVRALLPSQPMAAMRRDEEDDGDDEGPIRVGAIVASMVTNDRKGLNRAEMNALRIGADDSGGYMVTPMVGARIVDLARSASVAMKAGAQTVPMDTSELQLVQIASDATAAWRREMKETTLSQPSIAKIVLRAKMLSCIVPLSLEVIEDATNIVSVVEQLIQSAMGLALDRAILMGTGTEAEPRGITNQAGIQTVAAVGTPTDYQKVSSAVQAILTANYPGDVGALSWIQHPRDAAKYDVLEDSTGQPLNPTPWAAKLKQLMTTSLPITGGAGAEGTSLVGDFSQVLVGMRTRGVTLQVFDAGHVPDADGVNVNAVSQYVRFVRAYLRADVALLQPSWLAQMTGITVT